MTSISLSIHINPFSVINPNEIHGARAIENAAMLCHAANRAYCNALRSDDRDPTQVPWSEASEHLRASVLDGVRLVLQRLKDGKPLLPGESHESWRSFKLDAGWKVGPIKSEERKEHPNLVHFNQLPLAEQVKDHLFIGVATAALEAYGPRFAYWDGHATNADAVDELKKMMWRCTDPKMLLGVYLVQGRACLIAETATSALAEAFGHPWTKREHKRNWRVNYHVSLSMENASVVDAYDTARAEQYPEIAPALHEYVASISSSSPIATCASSTRFACANPPPLTRLHWFVVHGITRAVMEIEGTHVIQKPQSTTWTHAGE